MIINQRIAGFFLPIQIQVEDMLANALYYCTLVTYPKIFANGILV